MSTKTYSTDEAAEVLGVPYSTLAQQAREGRAGDLRPFQIGDRWRWPRRLVDAKAEGREVA